MRSTVAITAFAISLVTILSLLFVYTTNAPIKNSVAEPASNTQEEPKYLYTIRNYSGKLAVFEYAQPTPHIVFDVYISTLPENDQQDPNRGIDVLSDQEMIRLIEDFVS